MGSDKNLGRKAMAATVGMAALGLGAGAAPVTAINSKIDSLRSTMTGQYGAPQPGGRSAEFETGLQHGRVNL